MAHTSQHAADAPAGAEPAPAAPPTPHHSGAHTLGLAGIDLNLLVPLCALLEERSVTRAAERVRLSQPAMSHALRRIRLLLGDELLVRDGGVMRLTPRAQALVAPVQRALTESARVLTPHEFDASTDTRTVTLALTSSTAFVCGSLLRRVFDEHAPNMTMELRTGDVTQLAGSVPPGVDAVLLTDGLATPFPRERLYDDHWVVIASPEVGVDRDVREVLRTEPHIRFDAHGMQIRPYDVLAAAGIETQTRQTVSDYLLIPHFLREVRGVGVHRYQAALEFCDRDGLVLYPFPVPIAGLGVDVIWNPWLTDAPFQTWLRSVLREATAPLRARAATARV